MTIKALVYLLLPIILISFQVTAKEGSGKLLADVVYQPVIDSARADTCSEYLSWQDTNKINVQTRNEIGEAEYRKTAAFISELDRKAEDIKRSIRQSPAKVDIRGTIYYISANGRDANDGLSSDRPIRSLDKLNSLNLKKGDGVLFRRGDLWRGTVSTRAGVIYSAYGKGEKPKIYGSPCNAAEAGKWSETERPDVYVYDQELPADVGTLVFNEGQSCAFKVMKDRKGDGATVHIETDEPFNSYRDLKRDLDFYHDYKETRRLYLYSSKGNPASRFKSIELLVKTNIIDAKSNVTIDNLCLKYCGAHGIGSGTTRGLTVTNCELGWIGGSILSENFAKRSRPTRYGNAIQIYGGCDYFLVDNCYIYQIYDAGITHQYQEDPRKPVVMRNVTYSNNLVEDCEFSIEYYIRYAPQNVESYMDNIVIKNNLLRRAGFGWGKQRPDRKSSAHIKSWGFHYNKASDFTIRDNIFDRGAVELINIEAEQKDWLPSLRRNTYIQFANNPAGTLGSNHICYPFNERVDTVLQQLFGEKKPKILYAAPQYSPDTLRLKD